MDRGFVVGPAGLSESAAKSGKLLRKSAFFSKLVGLRSLMLGATPKNRTWHLKGPIEAAQSLKMT